MLELLNQHFINTLPRPAGDDAAGAIEGFARGDASLVQLLMTNPTKEALAKHAGQISTLSAEQAVAAGRLDAGMLKEPQAMMLTFMSKHVRSLGFVTRLYLAGGWDLVNRAWRQPPTLLAQLDDPQSYIDGTRAPAAIATLPALAGVKVVARWLEQKAAVTDCGPIAKQRDHAVVATLCVGKAAAEPLINEVLPKIGPLPTPQPPLGPMKLPALTSK